MKFEHIRQKFIRGKPGHVVGSEYFYFETQPKDKPELAIVCGGWEKCGFDYEVVRNSYPYYVIKYVLDGKGVFVRNGQNFDLAPNYLSGFSPKDPHEYRANTQLPMEHIFVIFTGTKARGLFERSTIAKRSAFQVTAAAESVYLIKSLFKTACAKPPYAQQICSAYLTALLLKQVDAATNSGIQTNAFKTFLYCKKYIDQNYLQIINIAYAAKACDINIRYMARLFRKYASLSPCQYVMRLRLNKAAEMLLNSTLSVSDISSASGFQDPYHFSKSFKKFHNLAPVLYRRLHINPD